MTGIAFQVDQPLLRHAIAARRHHPAGISGAGSKSEKRQSWRLFRAPCVGRGRIRPPACAQGEVGTGKSLLSSHANRMLTENGWLVPHRLRGKFGCAAFCCGHALHRRALRRDRTATSEAARPRVDDAAAHRGLCLVVAGWNMVRPDAVLGGCMWSNFARGRHQFP